MKPVSNTFFCRADVVAIAREMIGMEIFTNINQQKVGGIITETEAYSGETDHASHAFGGRRTPRTEIMYHQGGTLYVYLCYGIHSLLNIVTNNMGIPHAVLIRGIEPVCGELLMLQRLKKEKRTNKTFYGPGNVAKALGIHYSQSGMLLEKNNSDFSVWIEPRKNQIDDDDIVAAPRIGVDYAGEDAMLPWRFTRKTSL
ncbi:MAG: DNA-3-methyladenine glycosylase [Bacteroidales bacterium]|nr:DNA-3-methyladenine glycosylase [Bacteroidales bacterium]